MHIYRLPSKYEQKKKKLAFCQQPERRKKWEIKKFKFRALVWSEGVGSRKKK